MNLSFYFKEIKKVSKNKLLIGLTGQVGTGKSTILSIFKEKGAYTISSDEIANKLLTNKKCYSKILLEFGDNIAKDGKIDKKKLAQIIFSDSSKRKFLERLLHPLILKEIIRLVKQSNKKIVVIEVPLLFESGFGKYVDLIVCSYINEEKQFERLKKRGWRKKDIILRVGSQFPSLKKAEMSDIVIDNNKDISFLEEQISNLYNSLTLMLDKLQN